MFLFGSGYTSAWHDAIQIKNAEFVSHRQQPCSKAGVFEVFYAKPMVFGSALSLVTFFW